MLGAVAAGALALVVAALFYADFVTVDLGLYLGAAALAGLITYRWPAASMAIAFAMSGSYGSLKAFFGYPANGTATGILVGLTAASVGVLVFSRRRRPVVVWPAAVAILAYVLAVAADIPFSPVYSSALKVARTEGLYLLGMLVIAYGPWREGTHDRARRAIVWVALGVGAYATLRYGIGPSAKEKAQVTAVAFNQTSSGHNKVQGSFPSGVELGIWTSCVIPFLIGTILSERGRIRVVALAALPLCLIGLFGSGLRSGLVAAIVGTLVVLVLYALALSMPASRPLVLGAVVLGLGVGGAVLFPQIVGGNANSVQRYRNLLNPTQDSSYRGRLTKWEQAFSDLHGHPFGFGLGTVGAEASSQPYVQNVNPQLDSSYVRVAYEQGIPVMVLFIVGQVLLMAGLVRRSITTAERQRAGPAIAASGTLSAAVVLMFTEMFLTAPCALAIWVLVGLGMAPFTRRTPAQSPSATAYAREVPASMASREYSTV
jgi:hypothetical protein